MITVFATYDARLERHFISSSTDGDEVYEVSNGVPRDHWDAGEKLVRLALASGMQLTRRGDRYEHGGYALVIERTVNEPRGGNTL